MEQAEEAEDTSSGTASAWQLHHPWLSLYRNPHLKAEAGVLNASFLELQLAYGLLLRSCSASDLN